MHCRRNFIYLNPKKKCPPKKIVPSSIFYQIRPKKKLSHHRFLTKFDLQNIAPTPLFLKFRPKKKLSHHRFLTKFDPKKNCPIIDFLPNSMGHFFLGWGKLWNIFGTNLCPTIKTLLHEAKCSFVLLFFQNRTLMHFSCLNATQRHKWNL